MTGSRLGADARRVRCAARRRAARDGRRARTAAGGARAATPAPGTDYAFLLDDDEPALPDPRSRWQPDGVHGPSRRRRPDRLQLARRRVAGRALAGSRASTSCTSAPSPPRAPSTPPSTRLDHLVDLGVTHVELMPVNAFDGATAGATTASRWYAVHEPYGGPDGAASGSSTPATQRGLGVVLDVVYNHLGPSGNYLAAVRARTSPIGTARRGATRSTSTARARDEVRALHHRQRADVAARLPRRRAAAGRRARPRRHSRRCTSWRSSRARSTALSAQLGRPLSLIAESDLNDPRLIPPREAGGYGLTAQWSDDFHHALHAAADRRAAGLLRRLRLAGRRSPRR